MRKLFVSYARENKPDVDQLVEHLRTMGYDTWVDAALRGGQDWWDEILDRIADTDVVIAIYSAAALNSTACAREFEWATALGKPLLPVAVEPPPTALPSRFARRQILDYSQPAQRDRAALQLQGALATLPPAPPLPEPRPEPPKAPLNYLTDIIDLITQPSEIDHDQQHQILHQLEPALTSLDPLERSGGRDILERFSNRRDTYADVDRAITRLRNLPDPSAPPVDGRQSTTLATAIDASAEPSDAADQTVPQPPETITAPDPAKATHQARTHEKESARRVKPATAETSEDNGVRETLSLKMPGGLIIGFATVSLLFFLITEIFLSVNRFWSIWYPWRIFWTNSWSALVLVVEWLILGVGLVLAAKRFSGISGGKASTVASRIASVTVIALTCLALIATLVQPHYWYEHKGAFLAYNTAVFLAITAFGIAALRLRQRWSWLLIAAGGVGLAFAFVPFAPYSYSLRPASAIVYVIWLALILTAGIIMCRDRIEITEHSAAES